MPSTQSLEFACHYNTWKTSAMRLQTITKVPTLSACQAPGMTPPMEGFSCYVFAKQVSCTLAGFLQPTGGGQVCCPYP